MKFFLFALLAVLLVIEVKAGTANALIIYGNECTVVGEGDCAALGTGGGPVKCKQDPSITTSGNGLCLCEDTQYKKSDNEGCRDKIVNEGVCEGKVEGECVSTDYCKPNTKADEQKCKTKKTVGEICTAVAECTANAKCEGSETRKCACDETKSYKDSSNKCPRKKKYDEVCTDTTNALKECEGNLKCKVRSADNKKKCSHDLPENAIYCEVREDCQCDLACYGTTPKKCQAGKTDTCAKSDECKKGLKCTNKKCSGATVLKTSALTFLVIAVMTTFFTRG